MPTKKINTKTIVKKPIAKKKPAKKATVVSGNFIKPYKKLSLNKLTAFVAVIVVVGISSVVYSFAATPPMTYVEAEWMSYDYPLVATKNVSTVGMYWNTTGTTEFNLASDAVKLDVAARGDQCNGAPLMTIKVDSQVVMSKAVDSTQLGNYSIPVNISKGTHRVSASFTNDYWAPAQNCDRNLYIDKLLFTGAITVPVVKPAPTQTTPAIPAAPVTPTAPAVTPTKPTVPVTSSPTLPSTSTTPSTAPSNGAVDPTLKLTDPVAGTILNASWQGNQQVAIPYFVLGNAKPGAVVRVSAVCSVGECVSTTTAGADGKWRARLDIITSLKSPAVTIQAQSGSSITKSTNTFSIPAWAKNTNPNQVVLIGDSIGVSTESQLKANLPEFGTYTEAIGGRTMEEGMAIFENTAMTSDIKTFVFSLFTNNNPANIAPLKAAVERSINRPGDIQRCAVWMTISRPDVNGVNFNDANNYLLSMNGQFGGRLQIVDWAQKVRQQPDLLGSDRTHPTDAGNAVRAQMIAAAVRSCPVK